MNASLGGARPAPGLGGMPTHYGVYAADFARFGFAAGAAPVPTAVARLLAADPVEIALDPEAVTRESQRLRSGGVRSPRSARAKT